MQVLCFGCKSYISGASIIFRVQVLYFGCKSCISGASLVFQVQAVYFDIFWVPVLYFECKSCISGASLVGVRGSPERDISSLGTLAGWGLARLEHPSAAVAAPGLAWLGHFGKSNMLFSTVAWSLQLPRCTE